ncbi:MAG: hypothetical protein RLP09_45840 [Sandaracinaceae bacterium]
MRRRRPLHAKPIVGACFALVMTHGIGMGGLVLRDAYHRPHAHHEDREGVLGAVDDVL